MTTVGTVTVDLNNFGDMVNNSSSLGANVTEGVALQGDLIGLAIGVTIALGLLFGLVFLLFSKVNGIIGSAKKVGK